MSANASALVPAEQHGLLLVNLGTPDEPTTPAVRRYLAEFLSDPRVIDMNPIGRWLLLHGIILRVRPRKSAEAYRKVWSEAGSPLLVHGQALVAAVRERLPPGWVVELGMRYGNPSIASALARLRAAGARRVTMLPLYPQYSSAATGSSVEAAYRAAMAEWVVPEISVVGAFYDDPGFIRAFAEVGRPVIAAERPDHVLLSYHGLPVRHCKKACPDSTQCSTREGCCDSMRADNADCYRAQCFATSRALAAALELADGSWSVSFQSRLGRDPWIRPYTDHVIDELAARGKRRLVVFCPAFVADCLETLEEIGLRARDQFLARGGESLTLVPSLNATPAWAAAVASLARGQDPGS